MFKCFVQFLLRVRNNFISCAYIFFPCNKNSSITLFYLGTTNFLYRLQIFFLHFTHYFLLWALFFPLLSCALYARAKVDTHQPSFFFCCAVFSFVFQRSYWYPQHLTCILYISALTYRYISCNSEPSASNHKEEHPKWIKIFIPLEIKRMSPILYLIRRFRLYNSCMNLKELPALLNFTALLLEIKIPIVLWIEFLWVFASYFKLTHGISNLLTFLCHSLHNPDPFNGLSLQV